MDYILRDELQFQIEKVIKTFSQEGLFDLGFSLGVKTQWRNYADEIEQLQILGQTNPTSGKLLPPSLWPIFRAKSLSKLINNPKFDQDKIQNALNSCLLMNQTGWENKDIFFHVLVPFCFTAFVKSTSVLLSFLLKNTEPELREIFSDEVDIIAQPSELHNYQIILKNVRYQTKKGLFILNKGLLIWGEDSDQCIENYRSLSEKLNAKFPVGSTKTTLDTESIDLRAIEQVVPEIRNEVSSRLKNPVLIQRYTEQKHSCNISDERVLSAIKENNFLHSLVSEQNIRIISEVYLDNDLPDFSDNVSSENSIVIYHSKVGCLISGNSVDKIDHSRKLLNTIKSVISYTQNKSPLFSLLKDELKIEENNFRPVSNSIKLPFTGEIGLVTGAASGIGKACAKALLARGAVVVGLDINPKIITTFNDPNYLGLICDISDENAVLHSLSTIIQKFGGLDILVLNAGVFPKGCNIENIKLEEFEKVLRINLTSNLILLHEAYPLLKNAASYGRVVIVGSKNYKAPGPGAVAYSSSKAGLVQMGRIAAMEWAQDGIRVNIIHPDSVFDTGLYTDAVLQARAEFYGMTIEEYKKRNLLKTEITSDIVGEMVAEMCGNLFIATTGIQLQLDGGNDRTI